jgi:uncharacterized membrane protein YedE/YeeE
MEWIKEPMPWYIGGLLIGLMVPIMLWVANKQFGVSSSMKHMCAACLPAKSDFFKYDWKNQGLWSLIFVLGIVLGGMITGTWLMGEEAIQISEATKSDLKNLGVSRFDGLLPRDVFNWENLFSLPGVIIMVVGGFLVGFGSRYANGCTSGHSIMGLSLLSPASLLATIGFFIGGLFITHLILPHIFKLLGA